MAVALEACKRLHKRKELNDYLLPVGKDTIMLTALDEDPDEFIPNMNYKVGSARRRQLYDKRMAKALHNAIPRVGEECYIYVMEMDLIKAVPSFPLFLRQGRMQANIFLVKSRLLVDAQMLELLKAFHHYLFDNVLRLASERNTDTSEVDFKLDYAYVRNVVSSIDELPRVPTEVERLAFKFDAAKFQDAVVMPWYRDRDHPSFYYVAEIIDAKPSSKFPDDKFATFNDYFIQKYDIIIYDQEQPLLDVDYTSSRLNLLMPRHWSRSRSRIADERAQKIVEYRRDKFWYLNLLMCIQLLPLYGMLLQPFQRYFIDKCTDFNNNFRINSLLLADELRELVMREALCNPNYKTSDDICWTPLDYPTPMDDLEMKPCGTKSQVNKDVEAKDPDTGMVDFEIGVWDPELAKGLEDFCLTKARCNEVKGFDDVDGDALGLIMNGSALRQHGDMSDDDDEDAVVLFDFINSVHERLGKESGDIFAPRKNITSSGWDDLVVIEESAPNGINMPLELVLSETEAEAEMMNLSVNSGDSQIDSRGLMADLSRMSWLLNIATLPLASLDTMNQTNLDVRKETIKCDRKQNPSVARKPAQLYLDSLERLEDSDRISSKSNRQEECIDLIEFCDDMDKIFSNEYNETLPFDLNYFKGCLLDTDVELDTKVLSPKKILHQNGKLMNEQMVRSSSDLELFLQMSYDSDNTKLDCSTVDVNAVDRKRKQILGAVDNHFDLSNSFLFSQKWEARMPWELHRNAFQREEKVHEISAPVLDWITFSFEEDTFNDHPDGVSPCTLLQALTLSNASDGINLERLETVGDSFLKYAITDYLFHMNPEQHEGKLSFARSKEKCVHNGKSYCYDLQSEEFCRQIYGIQSTSVGVSTLAFVDLSLNVSNCNLYRLGRKHNLPSLIIGSKFDPNDGWLPPCYAPTSDFKAPNILDAEERDKFIENVLEGKAVEGQEPIKVPTGWDEADRNSQIRRIADGIEIIEFPKNMTTSWDGEEITPLPYNLLTQQSLGDKSIADAVESLIGAHLLELGPTATLKFMKWLGLKVLTESVQVEPPLLRFIDTPEQPDKSLRKLNDLWIQFQFSKLEDCIGYRFTDRAYLLQAFTHASYYKNRITGCYQRLEFLGDAVLDYVITRFLFQHSAHYSPGVLTDLRSALVNNTIFASLAVKYNFHKKKNLSGANFNDEMYMVTTEEEIDEGEEEDIEVPKAMGDIFESVAGAIYLDSGRSLDIVWRVFYNLMKETINECCSNPPRSPIRELLEMEPERARFSKLERILETGKVRVTVDIQGKCRFTGMGRSYRIAKCTAAKRALRYLRSLKKEKERATGKQ
ncbi:Endoribonuclease dcr-1 [Dirofilaria immitis]|nr:Endoribonuclease dcr-1 [Dirofilaria immitis]